ncbi:MAG: hypothetical protein L0211_10865 [Planctomycetaceae bacterium]|nr:hypothetical protein [Planctomycetaceae bacterium]
MTRWSLRSLFVFVAFCAIASRVGREAMESRAQERGLEGLRGLGAIIHVQGQLPIFL